MQDHTREINDLQADVAILGWLIEMLYVELLSKMPDGVDRIDNLARETSQQLTAFGRSDATQEEQDFVVDATLRSAERILGAIRVRVAKVE